MKKIVMMLAVALIVSGAVWAQAPVMPDPSSDPFLTLWAAPTISTEKRYSAGTFDTDVDNYIDPTAFDGQIGTFMFAGGFPGGVTGTTTPLTAYNRTLGKDTVSLGFGKSLGAANYLGIYYGGSFVHDAKGYKVMVDHDSDPDTAELASTVSDSVWRNNLAVLFGIGNMGITFDLVMDDTTDHTVTREGKTYAQQVGSAPTIALGWGANFNDTLTPWVKLGFKFPDTNVVTTLDNGKVDKKATYSEGATFGLDAGVWFALNDTSSALANLNVGAVFANSYKGDKDALLLFTGASFKDPAEPAPYSEGGAFAVELYLKYTKKIVLGDVTLKIKPNMDITFLTESSNISYADDKVPSNDWFNLVAGLDVGAEYRYDKIALYSGLGLTIFDWATFGHSGGKEKDNSSQWSFTGLDWDSSKFGPGGSLGFGLTFTPIEGLVFGTGLNLGAVFNPVEMTVNNPAGGYGSFWTNSALSITVSYKFANKAKEDKAEGTQTQVRAGSAQQAEGFAE